jgi:polyphosphate glucokinase
MRGILLRIVAQARLAFARTTAHDFDRMQALGVDIGGSGIKGAVVDTETGEFVVKRLRIPTPDPAIAQAVVDTVGQVVDEFAWKGPIGMGYPGVVKESVVLTAANLDKSLVGFNLGDAVCKKTGLSRVCILNDADAAGFAEVRLGEGACVKGVVMMITVGTGIGVSLFNNGVLLPNLEIGHIEFHEEDAESLLSEPARKKMKLSRKRWTQRFNKYLCYLEGLFWPDLFIVGGGGVKKQDKVEAIFTTRTPVKFAKFKNQAGIIGAAIAASENVVIR